MSGGGGGVRRKAPSPSLPARGEGWHAPAQRGGVPARQTAFRNAQFLSEGLGPLLEQHRHLRQQGVGARVPC